jgi:hypothetical protein
MAQGHVQAETHQQIEKAYCRHSGVISRVVETADGGAIDTGMIGHDGVVGASHTKDEKLSLSHVATQIAGTVSVVSSNHVRHMRNEFPAFRSLMVKYDQYFPLRCNTLPLATRFIQSKLERANGCCGCMSSLTPVSS